MSDPRSLFHPAVSEWFSESFSKPTRAQQLAWPEVQAGRSTLVFAPTGSGKTLAAFLAAIDRLMFAPAPKAEKRCRVLYVSPLRALAVDVERNLRAPLAGIARVALRRGDTHHVPAVAIRTGDTPGAERARIARTPPDILITTPESLFLILTSRARRILASVEVAIVDEIHVLVASKRGAHLALSLERLQELAGRPVQRIGLSATQRPLEEVARYLGGSEGKRTPKPRAISIVDAGSRKAYEIVVEVPVENMAELPLDKVGGEDIQEGDQSLIRRRSIWPAIHPRLLALIKSHTSTLIFVNSRRLAERLAGALNELAGEELVRAHHGSVAREERLAIEDALKAGRLPAMVATSSLELGIDMGAIDLVVQIETPPSVASGMQRIGRGSHQAGAVSRGVIFPKYRGDLLSTATITKAMAEGKVEATRIPQNPLDVLAQQIVAILCEGEKDADALFDLVRRAAPFGKLPRSLFDGVLDMLSGRYPSDEFRELRPRITWDRLRGVLRAREGAWRLAVANAGTIPDRGLYGVFLADSGPSSAGGGGRRVGELDEEMVFESQVGDVFVLGASSWRILDITRDRVFVAPASGEPGKMPFWKGDRPPRPAELGRAIGALGRELVSLGRQVASSRLMNEHFLGASAARNLLEYLADQKEATGALPDDKTLVLERTKDEMGDFRLCVLSLWGGRVHAPLTLAIRGKLGARGESDLETLWSDDGIVLRLSDRERPPDLTELLPKADEIEDLVVKELGKTPLFAAHFREAAARALLLPRRRPGQRAPLWMQRKRAHDLMSVASRFDSFPIVLEAYRECLQDVFDVPALLDLLRKVERREVRLVTVDTEAPSPFASSLLFGYVANYLYDGDQPLAERRAQALVVDQRQLQELLGAAELRELLDPLALAETELSLQGLDERQRVKNADRLHEMLLRVGDLSRGEIRARSEPSSAAENWLDALLREKRAIKAAIRGEERYAAVEDAARLRDALGVPLPAGLPQVFLDPQKDALEALVGRFARTHGPFQASALASRYGLAVASVEAALGRLGEEGRVLEGEFRPGGRGLEWCDAEVLKTLRRRSLARLRKEVEPAEPGALARFLAEWHLCTERSRGARGGPEALLDVVEQLQGYPLPASDLEGEILRSRLPDYKGGDLDQLCAAGEVVWTGLGPLGERDGKVGLFLADDLWLLHEGSPDPPKGELHEAIRDHLDRRGASFFADIHASVGGRLVREVLDALWDLVWAGEVTNDAPQALRAFLATSPGRSRERRRSLSSFRSRRPLPASATGRWSLLVPPRGPERPSPTARAGARATQLLARHGVLTREAVASEGYPGGFAALYPILRSLEEAGRARRGYFVSGLGGSQFADPPALDRLRARVEAGGEGEATLVLAASDPANPYGAALPWPRSEKARLARGAGSHVVLVQGALVAFLPRGEKEVHEFLPGEEPERSRLARELARGLLTWVRSSSRRGLGWSSTEGAPLNKSALAPYLVDAGFVPSGTGFRLPSSAPHESDG